MSIAQPVDLASASETLPDVVLSTIITSLITKRDLVLEIAVVTNPMTVAVETNPMTVAVGNPAIRGTILTGNPIVRETILTGNTTVRGTTPTRNTLATVIETAATITDIPNAEIDTTATTIEMTEDDKGTHVCHTL